MCSWDTAVQQELIQRSKSTTFQLKETVDYSHHSLQSVVTLDVSIQNPTILRQNQSFNWEERMEKFEICISYCSMKYDSAWCLQAHLQPHASLFSLSCWPQKKPLSLDMDTLSSTGPHAHWPLWCPSSGGDSPHQEAATTVTSLNSLLPSTVPTAPPLTTGRLGFRRWGWARNAQSVTSTEQGLARLSGQGLRSTL